MAAPLYAAEPGVLVLGRISDDPRRHHAQLQPLLDYVVARMGDVGITSGRILMARDAQQMASYLRRHRVHWVTETAGGAMTLAGRSGAQPLLITERDGVTHYHSVIFVRRDSTIERLDQLRGRRLAVQHPMSTSAYLVPVSHLLSEGIVPEILMDQYDTPSTGRVGYLFARTERNIATWVHKGMVDAGSVSSLNWDSDAIVPQSFRRDMRVLYRTVDYPRGVELVGPGVPVAVQRRLREVLLEAKSDPLAAAALASFFGTTGFLDVDRTSQQRLASLSRQLQRMRLEVE